MYLNRLQGSPYGTNAFAHQLRADAVLVSLPRARQLDALLGAKVVEYFPHSAHLAVAPCS